MPEKEKTLKESTSAKATVDEKVALAKRILATLRQRYMASVALVQDALTALEERVKELEKERTTGEAISKIVSGTRDLEPWEEEIVHEYYENKYNKEVPDDGGK